MSEPAAAPERRIAHLDMDAFYASVELLRYPQLEGHPVVIGGRRRSSRDDNAREGKSSSDKPDSFERLDSYQGRGVVTTATYAAREFGVHSGMGLMQAARLCPQAVLLPADFDEYRRYSRLFKDEIAAIAPRVEDRGIDEVYIDFDAVEGGAENGGQPLALRIQKAIRASTGLSCSIGVAPNKLLASEFDKPNGVTIIYARDLAERVWPLPCRKINGVGPKASARLEQLGVRTIGELARCELRWLIEEFGRHTGHWLHEVSWGRDQRELSTHSEPVSMSCETTFERDLHAVRDRPELSAVFTSLCERLAADLAQHGYAGRTIGVKLRYDNFQSVTRAQTLDFHTADAAVIRRTAGRCLKRAPLDRRLRLLGVRVGSLVSAAEAQSLAQVPPAEKSLDLF
jgi:DNA polymerase-4